MTGASAGTNRPDGRTNGLQRSRRRLVPRSSPGQASLSVGVIGEVLGSISISQKGGSSVSSKGSAVWLCRCLHPCGVLALSGCRRVQADANAEAPPEAAVVPGVDVSLFSVEHPDQFPLATATAYAAEPSWSSQAR